MCKENYNVFEFPWQKRSTDIVVNSSKDGKINGQSIIKVNKCICNRDIDVNEFIEMIRYLRKRDGTEKPDREKFMDGGQKKGEELISFYTQFVDVYALRPPLRSGKVQPEPIPMPFFQTVDIGKLDSKDNKYKMVMFVKALNAMFTRYGINTCKRKIHCLGQMYEETDRFRTTREYYGKDSYAGFRGRGMIQVTHRSNYLKYYNYIYETKYTLEDKDFRNNVLPLFVKNLSMDLYYALDSAGWYLTKLNKFYPIADKGFGRLNIKDLSWLINGKVKIGDTNVFKDPNGFDERVNYTTWIKEFFKYDDICVSHLPNFMHPNK